MPSSTLDSMVVPSSIDRNAHEAESDLDIALLLIFYGLAALMYIALERRSQRIAPKVVIAQ